MDLLPIAPGTDEKADVVSSRWPALLQGAFRGHREVCGILLDAGAEIDATSPDGSMTAVMEAASFGREEVVELLVERRADVNWSNEKGFNAATLACRYGHAGTVAKLVTAGADSD